MSAVSAPSAVLSPTRPAGEPPLAVRIELWDDSRRADAMALWRRLEAELQHDRLTSSAEWTETWLTHYGPLVPHRFAIGRRGAELVGICLATESISAHPGPLAIRTWHIGTAGEPGDDSVCIEFNSLLVRPDDRDDFVSELQRTLLGRTDCDAVDWDGVAPEELPQGFTTAANWQVRLKPTFYFDVGKAREAGLDPIALLGDSTRKGIRQNLRAAGDVQVDWSETAAQAEAYFAELIGFHQARWQSAGEPGSFASPVFRAFHEDILLRLLPAGKAAIVRVRSGQVTIGCTLLYIDRGRALVYQGGWSGAGQLKSPGLINDYGCLCECLRRGYDAYDFMAGDSIHKRRLTTDQGRLVWATCRNTLWKFQAIDRLRSAKRFLRSLWTRPVRQTSPNSTTEAAS